MAFSNITESEKLDIIDIAIVENEAFKNNDTFKIAFEKLSDENNRVFNIKYTSEKNAKKLLEEEKIVGYMKLEHYDEVEDSRVFGK